MSSASESVVEFSLKAGVGLPSEPASERSLPDWEGSPPPSDDSSSTTRLGSLAGVFPELDAAVFDDVFRVTDFPRVGEGERDFDVLGRAEDVEGKEAGSPLV